MSTKTTFKRIALVAVAALGFGMLSVAPSSAAPIDFALFPTVSALSTPATATIGDPVVGTFNQSGVVNAFGGNSLYTKAFLVAIPVTSALAPNTVSVATYSGSAYTQTSGTTASALHTGPVPFGFGFDNDYNGAQQIENTPALVSGTKRINGYFTATFTPDKAGTYVVAVKSLIDPTQVITWTVTAAAKVAANSTSTTSVATAVAPGTGDDTDGVYAPMAANAAEIASVLVTASNGATAGALSNSDALAKSATISGPGLMSWDAGVTKGRAVSSQKGTLAQTLLVYGDGTAGKATITITDGGFTKTETIVFYGASKAFSVDADSDYTKYTYSLAPILTTQGVASYLGVGQQQLWSVALVDAAGVTSDPTPAVTITIADKTILSDPGQGSGIVKVQGVKAGTTTFTVKDTATGLIVLGPITVNVSDRKAASATFTLDKSDYVSGEAFVLTINAKDANGLPFADGTYSAMASIATNVQVSAGSDGDGYPVVYTGALQSVKFSGGKATAKGFMPQGTGAVTFTLTLGANGVATAAQGAKLTATANVSSAAVDAATAAIDAAAEATDAANAATDAANAAAEAADAATAAAQDAADAVAALSAQVTEMIELQLHQLHLVLLLLLHLLLLLQR